MLANLAEVAWHVDNLVELTKQSRMDLCHDIRTPAYMFHALGLYGYCIIIQV